MKARPSGFLAAVALTTVLPVPDAARRPGRGVALWLPAVGVVVGALAAAPTLAVWRGGNAGSPLLAAVLAVAGLALLTRGLHLDGLADLADGLGSNRPAGEALRIMHASNIGPFGVTTVVLTLAVQTAALATVLASVGRPAGLLAVVAATCTGRVAVLLAAGRRVPAAAGSSFGALVAGTVPDPVRAAVVAATVVATAAAALGTGLCAFCAAGAVAAALGVAGALRRHVVRRLGGVTGDVFGALVEISTAVTWVCLAIAAVWS